jgi:hypothetical protein
MRVIAPELVGLMALLVISGIGLLLYGAILNWEAARQHRSSLRSSHGWWSERQRHRRDRAMRAAPWKHYSRLSPVTGEYLIGIERIWRDQIIQEVEIARVPHDDIEDRLNWEATAILRAQECNDTRSEMDRPDI